MPKVPWMLVACLLFPPGSLIAEQLKFCYDPFPPYALGPEGPAQGGLKVVLLEEVVDRIDGLTASVTLLPWKRCQSQTKAGNFDGILPLYENPDRQTYMAFTESAFDEQSVFWHRNEQLPADFEWSGDYSELVNLRLGMLVGSYVDDDMEAAFEAHQGITRSRDVQSLFALLIKGRVDLIATDAAVGRHVLSQNGWEGRARHFNRPIVSRTSHFGLSKVSGASAHLDAFNEALKELRTEGMIDRIYNSTQ